jgi:hypothetical protein
MIDSEKFQGFLPLAYLWAKSQEDFVLARGVPLASEYLDDARLAGVQHASRVRVLIVDRIPLPENEELAEAARLSQIITDASRGVAMGYAIIIRADGWGDRELMLHQLVHVAQCERCGGLEPYLHQYLSDRRNCATFTAGLFEAEARGLAREICATSAVPAHAVAGSSSSG